MKLGGIYHPATAFQSRNTIITIAIRQNIPNHSSSTSSKSSCRYWRSYLLSSTSF
ncbi:hypothetical protein PMIN01_09220 [Paraphaeosphaeria minitans]|uniref:Uncharacterized protein n=1 Tax=Paraphaeosphaeria minitans TaxID=565426 RepID=A0A9P6GAX0_9PLEO|nr:hypothetical protein PMIN01_09220 [Paraphaeosphaeria minitans]